MKKIIKQKNSKKQVKPLTGKYKILVILAILLLILIASGVTYAFFNYAKEGSTENTLKSGSITFWYDEINQSGNSIAIENALPMSDEAGKAQTDAFNFKIQSTTASTIAIPYEITLRQKEGTDNIGNIVKVYLAKTSSVDASVASEEEAELSLYSALSNVTKNGYQEKLLHTDIVPASDSVYTQFYRLKMWVDDVDFKEVENSETGELEYPYNNKTFTVTVNVYSEAHVTSDNSNLTSVGVNGTTLSPTTVNGIDTYTTTLPVGTTQATLNVETDDEYANVEVIKTQSDYTTPVTDSGTIQRLSAMKNRTVSVDSGDNYFKVLIESENNQTTKEIHFKISVEDPTLRGKILKDNPTVYTKPTLNNIFSKTSDKSGLYSMTVSNGFGGQTTAGTTYYFRGKVTNNKVKFAGLMWKVVRINEDGTVRLVLSDLTNNDTSSSFHSKLVKSYTSMYYSNSDIKNKVQTWYNTNIANKGYSSKVATGKYFCEAARVTYSQTSSYTNNGKANMKYYTSYTPDLVCPANDGNGKGLLNLAVGLLTYDEVVLAGGYRISGNNTNTGFYLYTSLDWWTMTPGGYSSYSYADIWYSDSGVLLGHTPHTLSTKLRPVINLKADTLATKDSNGVYVVD